ncbi:MAG: metallophosphoesterase family protein [Lachnospiraceae bacterium]|nr:metallophosphoesterase family protein [Lachnospiraceae bacterium]
MKIGVISDIHSNIVALKACTSYMESVSCEEYLFLGDYVSDTPYARETMDFLYDFREKHPCRFLRGNREEYMLSQREALANNREQERWLWNSASGNLLFTYEQLTEKDFDFFQSLPITFRYEKENYPAITCCHGSPESARELLQLTGGNTKAWLEKIDTEYMLCAHTHFPGEMQYEGKTYFNTGCVGIAISDCGFAQCMILEDVWEDGKAKWSPTFLKIPYDNKKVVEDIKNDGLLDKAPWFINSNIQILLTGVDNSAQMVSLALAKAQKVDKEAAWPKIEEKYFAEAAEELGIPDYRGK